MDELKIVTFNCRGLGSQVKRRDVLDYLKNLHYDIYLLQDTHLTQRKATFFNTLWRGKCYHSFGTFNSRGTSILFNPQTQHNILHEEHCPEGNYNIIVCTVFLNTYTIINIYGPNEDRPAFFRSIKQRLEALPNENIVIGGDFNFVLDFQRDSNYCRQNNPRARDAFVQTVEEQGLIDVWREVNPGKQAFTWTKQNPLKYGRLDMFFISDHLLTYVASSSVIAGYRSDHSMVCLHINAPQKKKGPGLWKFNESLLSDSRYDELIKKLIVNVIAQYAAPVYTEDFVSNPINFELIQFTISHSLFYESLLMMIRGETVKYSKQKARKGRERENEIISEIGRIRNTLNIIPNIDNLQSLEAAQKSLEDLRKPKIQGLITRSRVNWYEDGETCSKYFLSLEKRNGSRNSVQALKVNNKIVTDKRKILEHLSGNLRNKYRKKQSTVSPSAYLNSNIVKQLTEEQKKALDEPISLTELQVALTGMKKGKTPGSNGFTADFFKHFWELIGTFLYRAWLEKFKDSKKINSHNEGIVTLIPKNGVPKDSPKGWRPISLLNVDFKIISTAVANRLKTIIHHLVSPTQTAYIQGRFIGENSRLVYDVIEHLNSLSSSGIVMAVDFEAAFDTVSWEFLADALDKYNFGPYCKQLISVLYLNTDNFSRILVDGYLGSKIYMERGIRQGDPISGYLFNLIMEPLANQLKYSNRIKGIQISSLTEVRVSQYADDLIVFSSPESSSIAGILEELKEFTNVSGLKTNVEKTKCLPIGNSVNKSSLTDLGLNIVNELKVLGIVFNKSNDNISANNIAAILPSIEKEIVQWRRRNLTLIGKITVVKSLLVSKLVHVLSALPDPCTDTIKKLNSILFSFIWNNGADKIKRSVIVQSYEQGGLKMVDIQSFLSSLKTSWLKRLYWADHDVVWANIAKEMLPPVENVVCFGSVKLKELSTQLKNKFWVDVLKAWSNFCAAYKPDDDEIMTDKLWFSDNTKYTKTIIKDWDEKGLRFIADIFCKEDSSLHSKEQVSASFNVKMTFLCYASLVRSIPAHIRSFDNTKRLVAPILPYKIALLAKKIRTSHIVNNILVQTLMGNRNVTVSKTENKWHRDVGVWHVGTLRDIRASTKNTYLQSLHYRIVKRIIATNTFMHRIGRADSALCTFCKNVNETLMHALWDCNIVHDFIKNVESCIQSKFNITLSLSVQVQKWFFPRLEQESRINILIITLAKHTILRSKYMSRTPTIQLFLALLKLEASKEKGAALRRQMLDAFENKWGNVSNILQE